MNVNYGHAFWAFLLTKNFMAKVNVFHATIIYGQSRNLRSSRFSRPWRNGLIPNFWLKVPRKTENLYTKILIFN